MSSPFDIFGLGADPNDPESSPARKAQIASGKPLPKRFYDKVHVVEEEGRFALHLDGRPVRTPARAMVSVPYDAVAATLAVEWDAQQKVVDPKTMPLTRLVNSAIDGVESASELVREEIVRFAGTDMTCYRADTPERLVEQQTTHWDPVIAWAETTFDCRFVLVGGIMHVEQADETKAAIARVVDQVSDSLKLAALHSMTTLLGSCLLALAVHEQFLSADDAWKAAHIDEDWNIEQWGGDHDAEVRRAYRYEEMKVAALVVTAT